MRPLQQVIRTGVELRALEPGLYSVLLDEEVGAPYDSHAAVYDRMISFDPYLRVAWGVRSAELSAFVQGACDAQPQGWLIDVAAGTCVESARAYLTTDRPILVLDRSLEMLRRGMRRVRELTSSWPAHLHFVQGDANHLPVADDSMAGVLCLGALHVFEDPAPVLAEWQRVLIADGSVHLSSLLRGRWLGDRYLRLLMRSGEVAHNRSASELQTLLERTLGREMQVWASGNYGFAVAGTSDRRSGYSVKN